MGSGQSKFYRAQNNQQYPFSQPPPPPPHLFQGHYGPQYPQFAPQAQYGQMGYGQPPYPQQQQGFIPPGVYGQGAQLPPPQLNWLPQDKRSSRKRKSRRRESERFVGGFQPSATQQPEDPRRTRSESQHRPMPMPEPVIPTGMSRRPSRRDRSRSPPRASTPFLRVPTLIRTEDDHEDRHRGEPDHVRPPSRHDYDTPSPVLGTLADAIRPMEPATRAAFGPSGPRPTAPLRNPLPPPPRDLYEMTPYRSLLTLPQTTALLTATYGPQAGGGINRNNTITIQPAASVKKNKSIKGLLRAFSKKDKKPDQQHVQFIPVIVPPKDNNGNSQQQSTNHSQAHLPQPQGPFVQFQQQQQQQQQPADLTRSMSHHSRRPSFNIDPHVANNAPISPARTSGHSSSQSGSPIPPIPPMPSIPPAIRFDQDGQYNVFMNHSMHRVVYQGKYYPTALHLHEAMKFIGHHDEIAEQIRSRDIWEVYPIAAQYQQDVRPDWNDRYLDFMEEVLILKFTQHPDLRIKLLGTGNSRLVYSDVSDSFWGSGPNDTGANELGKALVRVRDRLRPENMSTMY